MISGRVSRRDVLRFGSGIVVAFPLAARLAWTTAQNAAPTVGSLERFPMLDAWLRIAPDGSVTVFTGKVELGQGILTSIAQIAAEELDVALRRVRIVSGDTALCPDEGWTAGSLSIEQSGLAVRQAAAEARRILVSLAGERFGERVESLRVVDGTIQGASGRMLTYWTLARENPLHRKATLTRAAKSRSERRIVGTSVPRIDLPAKFRGAASFVQDMRLPDMVHGRIVRPPSPGATLVRLDESRARTVPGVLRVVRDGNFVGVVAEREEQAIAARTALLDASKWREHEAWPLTVEQLPAQLRKLPHQTFELASGSPSAAAGRRIVASYSKPFIAHASIGPSAAIAAVDGDALSVWTHSQAVFPLRRALAKVLQLPLERLHVRHEEGSGCYGHNGQDDVALDAALLARAVPGRPVRVQWMREDEFAWEPFGSAMSMRVECDLSNDGAIAGWRYEFWTGPHAERADLPSGRVNLLAAMHLRNAHPRQDAWEVPLPAGGGSRNALPYYSFPASVTERLIMRLPIRTSSLRSLGAYANVFAIESMMDEAASSIGADPIAFRLRHLGDERARRVLKAVAEAGKWKPGAAGDGRRGRGVAFARYKNLQAYVAMIADVDVDGETGDVRAVGIHAAVDAGEVINPDGLKNQIEGGIVQALSWTLKEEVRFDERRIITRSWADYPILTFSEVPDIHVLLLESPGDGPLGAGEPSVPPVGAAIANAIASATGVRLRRLPFTAQRVRAALAAAKRGS